MSLVSQVSTLATRIGTEIKAVRSELAADVAALPVIDDTTTGAAKLWSSSKVSSTITAQAATTKADILGGASAAWDTLQELHDIEITDESTVAGLTTAVGNRLRVDAAQSLTSGQKTQGQSNLDVFSTAQVGDVTTDFVAVFNAALV